MAPPAKDDELHILRSIPSAINEGINTLTAFAFKLKEENNQLKARATLAENNSEVGQRQLDESERTINELRGKVEVVQELVAENDRLRTKNSLLHRFAEANERLSLENQRMREELELAASTSTRVQTDHRAAVALLHDENRRLIDALDEREREDQIKKAMIANKDNEIFSSREKIMNLEERVKSLSVSIEFADNNLRRISLLEAENAMLRTRSAEEFKNTMEYSQIATEFLEKGFSLFRTVLLDDPSPSIDKVRNLNFFKIIMDHFISTGFIPRGTPIPTNINDPIFFGDFSGVEIASDEEGLGGGGDEVGVARGAEEGEFRQPP